MKNSMRLGLMAGLIVGSTLLQNCGSDDPTPQATEVFVAGYVDDSKANYSVAYTKNGAIEIVGDGSVYEYANDCTIEGNDFYMAGISGNDMAYWKNGVRTIVPKDPSQPWEEITQIIIKNGKKYFQAYSPAGTNAFRYYVDDARTILVSPSSVGEMSVSSTGDVYVVGASSTGRAVYWKNGVENELSTQDSGAAGIHIVGSDVYITGYYYNAESMPIPVYWKNGTMTELELSEEGVGARPEKIFVSGDDVFVAGQLTDDNLVMWENGVMTTLVAEGVTLNRLFDLEVKKGNVYVLCKNQSTGKSFLLKNGALVAPFNGTQQGEFSSMAIN